MSLDRKVEKVNIWSRALSRAKHENNTAGWLAWARTVEPIVEFKSYPVNTIILSSVSTKTAYGCVRMVAKST